VWIQGLRSEECGIRVLVPRSRVCLSSVCCACWTAERTAQGYPGQGSHPVQYSTVQYSTVQYSTVHVVYSTVHVVYSTVHVVYSTVQHSAVQYI
jgi:hypothetical protein